MITSAKSLFRHPGQAGATVTDDHSQEFARDHIAIEIGVPGVESQHRRAVGGADAPDNHRAELLVPTAAPCLLPFIRDAWIPPIVVDAALGKCSRDGAMFLRNCWYAAAWSNDLADAPHPKIFLNEKVVLFRTASGRPAVLADQCCHRAAPLSRGEIQGENLACGYHGLQFDTSGRCVLVPGQMQVPAGAQVRSYPVHERWNVVWIWMGDPALADPDKIPALTWLADSKWTVTPGMIQVRSNYEFIIDNLLDLTHVTYVHKKTLAGDPREATTPTRTERLPNGVRVGRWMLDFVPPPLFAKAGNFKENVDRWQFVTWTPPST